MTRRFLSVAIISNVLINILATKTPSHVLILIFQLINWIIEVLRTYISLETQSYYY